MAGVEAVTTNTANRDTRVQQTDQDDRALALTDRDLQRQDEVARERNVQEDRFDRQNEEPPRAPDGQPPQPVLLAQATTPAPVAAAPAATPLRPADAIRNSTGTFELASRELEAGRGDRATQILRGGATELRRSLTGANAEQTQAINALATNMDARANMYGETAPRALRERAQELAGASWQARRLGEDLQRTNPELSRQLTDVGLESRLQAEISYHAADNTDSLLGRGVGQTYRAITNASFDQAINNTGAINNFFTGNRDQLVRDKERAGQVFDALDQKMAREGISFDRAWNGMFNDHRINSPDRPGGFPTAHEAAVFIRDHQVTRGLLSPMADIARNLTDGNNAGVDRARGDLVQALRTNGQWDISRNVLNDLQANARSPEGQNRAQALNDTERREWWTQKAGEFVQQDLPVLLLSTAVSGGVGLGARALTTAAGLGTRAVRGAQIAAEIGSFVPTERVLNDVVNNRRADWTAGGLARDYALTAGGYGLFHALGAGYRALRAPRAVGAELGENAAHVPTGRPTRINPADAPENIRALNLENESATTLARNGYRVEQNPVIPGGNVPGVKHPDYRIGGEFFDNFAPTTGSARNIWTTVEGKVASEQARRIVLNLDNSAVNLNQLRQQFQQWPINGLEQVLVVQNGRVFPLQLARPNAQLPFARPHGYPHQEQR